MLFDCFLYFNERELLELRVEMLKDIVDGFIITDANRTFKGDEKPFTCVDTIRELGLPEDKMQVLHVELPPPDIAPSPWIREAAILVRVQADRRLTPTIATLLAPSRYQKPSIWLLQLAEGSSSFGTLMTASIRTSF